MTAMRLHRPGEGLRAEEIPVPEPGPGELLLEVLACGVCRTDLHIADGELAAPRLPLVPGHEIVGRVAGRGPGALLFAAGERVGVPWLASACGACGFCRAGRENLCKNARFTGLDRDGGYAGYAIADERFCFPIPESYGDEEAAPLLCAGFIGYRALRMAGDARRLGIYGFGAAGHIIAQIAVHQGRQVFAFTRPGDGAAQAFARRHPAHDFVAGDQRQPRRGEFAVGDVQVGAADPAREHLEQQLARSRLGHRDLLGAQRRAGTMQAHGGHGRAHRASLRPIPQARLRGVNGYHPHGTRPVAEGSNPPPSATYRATPFCRAVARSRISCCSAENRLRRASATSR